MDHHRLNIVSAAVYVCRGEIAHLQRTARRSSSLLHALRSIVDEFLVWPARRSDAVAMGLEFRVGGLDLKRPDGIR